MPVRPLVVAAALVGACLTAFLAAALAFASGGRVSATVTLQIAPRGLGIVTVTPPDNDSVGECSDNHDSGSCTLTYNRGEHVKLTASSEAGRTLSSWSTPDCPGTGACDVSLDDDTTSIVALFNPLRLGVVLSSPDGGTVSADPAGTPCPEDEDFGDGVTCLEYAPGTQVKLTVKNAAKTFDHWNPGCEPTNAMTCTVTVDDETTWAGAHFVGDPDGEPQLPTTINVEFQLKRGGTGSGRVSGSDLDCGSACSRQYGYGNPLTLTAVPDQGSVFSGWNGVCSKTETKCTFPVGPITSIRAIFDHDSSPPSSPGGLTVTSTTRTGIEVSWAAATDNLGVAGYRVYLNGATADDTTDLTYGFAHLLCGHRYALAVDATDAAGNRSPTASITASTAPCRLVARLAGVGVLRRGHSRRLVVKLRMNRPTTALLALARRRRVVAHARYRCRPGTNVLRLRISKKLKNGPLRLKITLVDPDGGTLVLPGRGILLPRPK